MPGSLARAEIALIEGRPDEAIDLATRVAERRGTTIRADLARSLDITARAHLQRDEGEAAAAAARRGADITDAMGFDAIGWRLHRVESLATRARSDRGADLFRALAERIEDPELRSAFERQPLAPT